ncbi:hypothetical protein D3C87_1972630 [compost metagenome]
MCTLGGQRIGALSYQLVHPPGFFSCLSQANFREGTQADIAALFADHDAKHPTTMAGSDAKMETRRTTDCMATFGLDGGYGSG